MRVSTTEQRRDGTRWLVVTAEPEPGDSGGHDAAGTGDDGGVGGVRMGLHRLHVELPEEVDLPHPDVRALIGLLCVQPWVAERLELDTPVSRRFADAARTVLRREVGPVDPDLAPRERPEDGQRALGYSGGTDCTAAAALMPAPTALYFLERVDPVDPDADALPTGERRGSVYDLSAARHSCTVMERHGFTVRRVRTDLEHAREPVGFPHDFSTIVPALVWADADRVDGLGWGAPLEAVYRLQVGRFRPYDRSRFARWAPLFAACGFDVVNALAGVSEPGTSEIVRRWASGEAAQSCMRGRPGRPCHACWKCARKELLGAAVATHRGTGEVDTAALERALQHPEPVAALRRSPIKVEISIAHAVRTVLAGRAPDAPPAPLLEAIEAAVVPQDTSFLWRHYPLALNKAVPARHREEVRARIEEFLEPMTPEQVQQVRGFDATGWWGSPEQQRAHAHLVELLDHRGAVTRVRSQAGRVARYLGRRVRRR